VTQIEPIDSRAMTLEKQLVEKFCRTRDESAFRELYRLHTPLLYRVCLRMLGNEPAAQDAIQEVWLRADAGLAQFRWQSSLSTWLVGIAINRCREIFREKYRSNQSPESPPEEIAPGTPAELQLDLARAVSSLAAGYREVLLLHDVEGYTHEEISVILGIDAGTSKSQLSRARKILRERLHSRGTHENGDPK
jgi:RNA polymerase sigma-70 factor, ECF subfamily